MLAEKIKIEPQIIDCCKIIVMIAMRVTSFMFMVLITRSNLLSYLNQITIKDFLFREILISIESNKFKIYFRS